MSEQIRIIFCGRKLIAVRCLEKLLRLDDFLVVAALTEDKNESSELRALCESGNVPVYSFDELNTKLKNREIIADLGFSVLYWKRFHGSYLKQIPMGIVNFHPAPLPGYKGLGGYNLALLRHLTSWGITAHLIDEKIDTGGILDQMNFEIDPDGETIKTLQKKCERHILIMFERLIKRLRATRTLPHPRPNEGGEYTSSTRLEELKEIQTTDTNEIIDLKIRAFWYPPYTGAKIKLGDKWYTLVNQEVLDTLGNLSESPVFKTASEDDN